MSRELGTNWKVKKEEGEGEKEEEEVDEHAEYEIASQICQFFAFEVPMPSFRFASFRLTGSAKIVLSSKSWMPVGNVDLSIPKYRLC